ncbi:GGDEF domain-containing protein [Psychromonas aquimarina]|uniref:GGDEF domain-containing protein n=1 Tax=Psychromonas aquimarina TaxID=444919 RepID=UPI0004233D3D|nr:GGDEF domain-containing protein [Psychromonas aquimarina]
MNLDIHTLFIINTIETFIIALVMFVIWRTQKSSLSLGWIALAFACQSLGTFLVSTRDSLPYFSSIIIANTAFLLWVVFLWRAIRDFQRLAFPVWKVLGALFVFICLSLYFTYIYFDTDIRVIIFSLYVTFFSILSVNDLVKPVHSNSSAIENKYTAGLIMLFTGFMVLRAVVTAAGMVSSDFAYAGLLHQFTMLVLMAYSLAFVLAYLWLLQRRFESEIEQRADALQAANSLTELLRQEAEDAALHDPLTLAGNRRKFETNADLERERHLRHQRNLCLAFVDIDLFKAVNDKFGHDVGDQVLKSLVSLFTDITRNIDMIYRWGGEEFIILLPETDLPTALLVCDRIRGHIQSNLNVEGDSITISIGVAQLTANESINELVKRADKLLYKAKQKGRNCVVG